MRNDVVAAVAAVAAAEEEDEDERRFKASLFCRAKADPG